MPPGGHHHCTYMGPLLHPKGERAHSPHCTWHGYQRSSQGPRGWIRLWYLLSLISTPRRITRQSSLYSLTTLHLHSITLIYQHNSIDIINIVGFTEKVSSFNKRRQRLLGPNGATQKAIELLTGCNIFMLVSNICKKGVVGEKV